MYMHNTYVHVCVRYVYIVGSCNLDTKQYITLSISNLINSYSTTRYNLSSLLKNWGWPGDMATILTHPMHAVTPDFVQNLDNSK